MARRDQPRRNELRPPEHVPRLRSSTERRSVGVTLTIPDRRSTVPESEKRPAAAFAPGSRAGRVVAPSAGIDSAAVLGPVARQVVSEAPRRSAPRAERKSDAS